MWQHLFCMMMPVTWRYTDIYSVIIQYIAYNLNLTSCLLNFIVIAINEIHPKVIVRFTLKNVRNNLSKGWTQTIEGETSEDLFESVYAAVEPQKIVVWQPCRYTHVILLFLCSGFKALHYPGC